MTSTLFPNGTVSRRAYVVVAICFLITIFDGYDVIVYGSVVPGLLTEPGWHLGKAEAGAIASFTLLGMLAGALISGPVADRIGRRRLVLVTVSGFTVLTALSAAASSPEIFGVLRFLTGLGLGGVLPSAIALTVEFAPAARRQLFNGLISAGFPIGGILAAAIGLVLLPHFGWRSMFLFGLSPALAILPAAIALLPNSPASLHARGRTEEAQQVARRYGLEAASFQVPARRDSAGLKLVFNRRHIRATAAFSLASLCALLLAYGLSTWLPQMMHQAGYSLGSSLLFLLALNLGATVLGTLASFIADRIGPKRVVMAAFLVSAASLLFIGIGIRPGEGLLLAAVAVAGLGGSGTMALTDGYAAAYYPQTVRASGLGVVLAMGRIGAIVGPLLGAVIVASGAPLTWNFVLLAAPALLGAIFIACGPALSGTRCERSSHDASASRAVMSARITEPGVDHPDERESRS